MMSQIILTWDVMAVSCGFAHINMYIYICKCINNSGILTSKHDGWLMVTYGFGSPLKGDTRDGFFYAIAINHEDWTVNPVNAWRFFNDGELLAGWWLRDING